MGEKLEKCDKIKVDNPNGVTCRYPKIRDNTCKGCPKKSGTYTLRPMASDFISQGEKSVLKLQSELFTERYRRSKTRKGLKWT